jgi:hypothetical protein
MKKLRSTILIIAVLLTANCFVPNAIAGPGLPEPPEDTPIDGGVTLVLAATAAYGVKKLRDKRRNK